MKVLIVFVTILASTTSSSSSYPRTKVLNNHIPQIQRKSQLHDPNCLPWFCNSSETGMCHCFPYYGCKCFGQKAALQLGFCATYDAKTGLVSFVHCPYFQSHRYELFNSRYVLLPRNLSVLNDYMCKPLNREGKACGKCIDGYGPTVTPVGVRIQCAKCTNTFYGVMLYLLIEFVPITALYFLLLVFRISVTSAPMTCFIMCSQLIVQSFDRIYAGGDDCVAEELHTLSPSYELLLKLTLSVLDIWNLRFFHYFIPPFCISSQLKPIHMTVLGYLSAFYPVFLMFITWCCIELHGRNFRPLVLLWRPFHGCFVRLRRGWDTSADIIDVFASFFLLSFSRMMYQGLLLLTPIDVMDYRITGELIRTNDMLSIDLSIKFASTQHLIFAVPAIIIFFVFNLLPAILLIVYPIKAFRICLAKFKLDTIALKIFVEKYQGCYRDTCDGGRDMRSFSGLYFIVRISVLIVYGIADLLKVSNNDPWLPRGILFSVTALVIALLRPYKATYMNILDTLLLIHLAIFCHLMSSCCSFIFHYHYVPSILTLLSLPIAGFVLAGITVIYNKLLARKLNFVLRKLKQRLVVCYDQLTSSLASAAGHSNSDQQQLLNSANIGSMDYRTIN